MTANKRLSTLGCHENIWLRRPPGYREWDLLGLCAPYSTNCVWKIDEPHIVFFQEHRMAIPPIWAALQDGIFSEPPMLVRIDAHTDFGEDTGRFDYESLLPKIRTLEDCILFANALSANDGGWVESVIRFGWVSNVISLYVQPSEWESFDEPLIDIDGKSHVLTVYPDISDSPPDLGCGQLQLDARPLMSLIDMLEIDKSNPDEKTSLPIWLDIDLDFAVENVRSEERRALGRKELGSRLSQPIRCIQQVSAVLASEVLSKLMSRSRLITIASEPDFSCGFGGVTKILDALRYVFPEHKRLFNWFE